MSLSLCRTLVDCHRENVWQTSCRAGTGARPYNLANGRAGTGARPYNLANGRAGAGARPYA